MHLRAFTVMSCLLVGSALADNEWHMLTKKKIDLSKKEADGSYVKGTCERIKTGESVILAIGMLTHSFVILTTDLFIFELEHKQVNATIKPFKVLINDPPQHLSTRLPNSYSQLVAISEQILYGFTMATNGNTSREYLVLAYGTNATEMICLFAIDVRRDQAIDTTLCYSQLAAIQLFSTKPEAGLTAKYFEAFRRPQLSCFFHIAALADSSESACLQMDTCTEFQVLPPEFFKDYMPNMFPEELPEDSTGYPHPLCINISGIITAGYSNEEEKLFFIDDQAKVHFIEDIRKREFVVSPMADFIGCDVSLPFSFSIPANYIPIVVAVAVVVQVAICVGIYFALRSTDIMPAKGKRVKKQSRNSKKKSKKSRKSIKRGKSTKSRRSITGKDGSKSSKSRKSRGSISAVEGSSKSRKSRGSTSRSRLSRNSANSISISKRRGSQISGKHSRSSKSRLSRGSSKHSKSVVASTTKSFSRSSVSKRRDSKSTAKKSTR